MTVTYRVRADAAFIEARAQAIAIEQSVETPLAAISDERVLRDIVGEVQGIRELEAGLFEVRIGLAVETTGFEAGQLLNMLFGNTSMQEDALHNRPNKKHKGGLRRCARFHAASARGFNSAW